MRWGYALFALGIIVCLIGAFLMAFGEPIVGENHAGIAMVVGITGIGIICTSGALIAGARARAIKA